MECKFFFLFLIFRNFLETVSARFFLISLPNDFEIPSFFEQVSV